MPRAVLRSDGDRPAPWRCSTSSQSESSGPGTPARTRRGRSTRPWCVGAGATADSDAPAHFVVSEQYRSPARSVTSICCRSGGSPCSAASTQNPMIRTSPALSMSTFSGVSRPWATPASWARAIESATSDTSQADRRGPSGPVPATRMSREMPEPHSLTT